jgi:hypothetical protein
VAKKLFWNGYKNPQDYFANAPEDLLQKHYGSIKDFEAAMSFTNSLMKYRHSFPLLEANGAIYDQLGIEVN